MARTERYPEGSSYQDILYYQDQFECEDCENIFHINEEVTDLKASITLLELIKKSFTLPIKKKYSLENIDDITKNLQNKRDQLEKDLDTFQFIDAEDKRKSLYI